MLAASGEVCALRQPLPLPPPSGASGALRLESWLPALEASLREALVGGTRDCVAALGHMSAETWVGSFPSQAVMLVDAVVWTQSVTSTLERAATGERSALRNLLDQSVLRLETMARQLRGAMLAAPPGAWGASAAAAAAARAGGGGVPGRQVEDLPGRAAAAALTAAGASTVALQGGMRGGAGTGGGDESMVLELDLVPIGGSQPSAPAVMQSPTRVISSGSSAAQQPPRLPPFLLAAAANTAAAAASAAATAAAAVPSGPGSSISSGGDAGVLGLDTGVLVPACTSPYMRPRRSAVFADGLGSLLAGGDASGGGGGGGGGSAGGTGMGAVAGGMGSAPSDPVLLTRQTLRGMERLLAAGICHRQVRMGCLSSPFTSSNCGTGACTGMADGAAAHDACTACFPRGQARELSVAHVHPASFNYACMLLHLPAGGGRAHWRGRAGAGLVRVAAQRAALLGAGPGAGGGGAGDLTPRVRVRVRRHGAGACVRAFGRTWN